MPVASTRRPVSGRVIIVPGQFEKVQVPPALVCVASPPRSPQNEKSTGQEFVTPVAKRARFNTSSRMRNPMARWPDNTRANWIGFGLIFVLFPLLCWLAWRWLYHVP